MTPEEHRRFNTLGLVLIIGVVVLIALSNEHNIEDCEQRLFEKLTEMKMPKELK